MRQKTLKVLFSIPCLVLSLAGQQNPPPISLVPVAGPVYMLQGGGGNIGIVADDAGLIMIDSMYERVAGEIRQAVKSLPGGDRVRILVNTHWHSDHFDGNKAFGPGAVIIAHENVRALLAKDQALLGGQTKALPASALPNVTFSDKLTAYAGGEVLRSSWVGQLDAILAGLSPDAKIIPGHGPLAGVEELKAFRNMLAASAELVRKQMNAGKTLDEIKASVLPASLEPWTKGFLKPSQWLELVYRSLEKR